MNTSEALNSPPMIHRPCSTTASQSWHQGVAINLIFGLYLDVGQADLGSQYKACEDCITSVFFQASPVGGYDLETPALPTGPGLIRTYHNSSDMIRIEMSQLSANVTSTNNLLEDLGPVS